MKRLFITGSGGFVGGALVNAAGASEVRRISHAAPLAAALAGARHGDVLIHTAWPDLPGAALPASAGDGHAKKWLAFVDWSEVLAAEAARLGMWVIGIGSGVERYADDPRLVDPYRGYALRKQDLHDRLARICGAHFSWLRLHFLFGPGERESRIVPAAIAACRNGRAFSSASTQRRRRWMHIADAADLIVRFSQSPQPGTFDITGYVDISFERLFELIERATGENLRLAAQTKPAADAALTVIAPENMAPIVPSMLGDVDNLLARLTEYVHWLDTQRAEGTKEG
ncbi:MAG: NAD(P)-dependent oxidoreductase [Parvularculaceae bacterium]